MPRWNIDDEDLADLDEIPADLHEVAYRPIEAALAPDQPGEFKRRA